MSVRVVAPDPSWVARFEAERSHLAEALGPAATAIHHIGSTAIPGIWAKPIVDVLLEAPSLAAIDERTAALETLGYRALGENGIPGRRYFRRHDAEGGRRVHLHAFAKDSAEITRHLAFRDYLRCHPETAARYSLLKRQLATRHPEDRRAYVEGKAPFVQATEERALAWWSSR